MINDFGRRRELFKKAHSLSRDYTGSSELCQSVEEISRAVNRAVGPDGPSTVGYVCRVGDTESAVAAESGDSPRGSSINTGGAFAFRTIIGFTQYFDDASSCSVRCGKGTIVCLNKMGSEERPILNITTIPHVH